MNRKYGIAAAALLLVSLISGAIVLKIAHGMQGSRARAQESPTRMRAASIGTTNPQTDYDCFAKVVLTCDHETSVFMTPVTWTATVTPYSNSKEPTGWVFFKTRSPDGQITVTIGKARLVNGAASFTKSRFVPGVHPVFADYVGDKTYIGDGSNILNLVVLARADEP